jgi:hypothetical protein
VEKDSLHEVSVMRKEDLKPGVYVLTRDVTNPKPDRRVRDQRWVHDWPKWVTIPKGMRFRVINRAEKYDLEVNPDRELWTLVDLENYMGGGSYGGLREGICWHYREEGNYYTNKLFLDLIDALEPAPKHIDVYCYDRGMDLDDDASDLIVSMVRNGMLSWRALEQAIEQMHADQKADPERKQPLPVLPKPIDPPWSRGLIDTSGETL